VSHPRSRRPVLSDDPVSLGLVRMLRDWRDDHDSNVRVSLRRHKFFLGPAERRRLKHRLALKRESKRLPK